MDNLRIVTGRSRHETKWKTRSLSWTELVQRLSTEKRTGETVAAYQAMTREQRGAVKDIGGFVGGTLRGDRRKASEVLTRSLITLDIDYGTPNVPDIVADMLCGTAWCLYTTHSHTPQTPRYRLVIPLSREVSADEYTPIALRIADDIGITLFDQSTYEPSRLMYWPSAPKDGEFIALAGDGEPADADMILDSFNDWRNVAEWPVDPRGTQHTAKGAKQEDPRLKTGIIGAFCRSYSITEAMDTFLPGVYAPTAQPDRWTFAGGSTFGGVVIYDDTWAYSHHGTDPAGGKLCNAFDLVRLHLFADQDEGTDMEKTPVNKVPSFVAMERMARDDKRVGTMRAAERMKELEDDFAEVEGAEPQPEAKADPKEAFKWTEKMQMDERKKHFLPSPYNFGLIVRNDPRLKDRVRRDAFRGRDCVVADLPWRKSSDTDPFWNNSDDNGLIDYVSRRYQLTGKQALLDANDLAMSQNSFHPVREWLQGLKWDGVGRLDTLLSDYLGAEDNPLTRAMTRKHFTAAVARVMRPGCKYDYILTLIGPQGIGKSTLVKILGGDWFDDSLTSIEGKEGMEQIRGKWLIEFGELTNYKKSTSEAYKAFISKQEDSYRPAYGRKVEIYPRQCVFFATTNEPAFLKGDTGNRRFWTVECDKTDILKDVWDELPQERDQIWAEALHRYREGEKLYLPNELEKAAQMRQDAHNEVAADERIGVIEAFIRRPIPENWEQMGMKQRRDYFLFDNSEGITSLMEGRQRRTITAVEVLVECFGQPMDDRTRYRTKEINQILRGISWLRDIGRHRDTVYGQQRTYEIQEESL
jgi:predicted P-loop ATPase